jgi:DNA repair protein RadC
MFAIGETEHARSKQLDNPESIYRACADMKLFNQEVLRVILLDTRYRHISTVEITKGSINESLAHPRDIFRPVIGQSAYAFVLVHNHPSGDASPSEADMRLTRRLAEGARILQINMLASQTTLTSWQAPIRVSRCAICAGKPVSGAQATSAHSRQSF